MTFRSLLKIVRKGADFNFIILFANIERRCKEDSYCDYIRISQIYIAGRNINLVQKVALCFRIKKHTKNMTFWHTRLETVNCVISDVILQE